MARSPVIAYDARDFLSLTQAFRRYLNSSTRFQEKWSSFNPEDPATAILELQAYGMDVHFIYQEWIYNQAYTRSMTTRRAAIDNGSLLGKELNSASPATVTERLTVDVLAVPFQIQARYLISNGESGADEIFFEYDSDTALTVTSALLGVNNFIDLSFIEGRTYTNSFSNSDGSANQEFSLVNSPYIDETMSFLVNGVEWTEVSSLFSASSSDEVYTIVTNELDETRVVFGDGVYGKIPNLGYTMQAAYRVGGGSRGRVGIDVLQKKVTTNSAVFSVTNLGNAIGGEDKETVEQARRSIPAHAASNDRFVTTKDHSSGLDELSGVSSVLVLLDPNTPAKGIVYVVPAGGGDELTGSAISNIRQNLRTKGMMGVRYEIRSPLYVRVIVSVSARADTGVDSDRLRKELTTKLTDVLDFDKAEFTFGTEVSQEDIFEAARKTRKAGFGFDRFDIKQLRVEPDLKSFLTNTGRLDTDNIVITIEPDDVLPYVWEFHAVDSRTFDVFFVRMARASEVSENIVTDGGSDFSDVTVVEKLRPRLDNPSIEYSILSVSGTQLVADLDEGFSLQDEIEDRQQFGVVFQEPTQALLGEEGTGTVLALVLTDVSKSWDDDEWIGSILKDSTGAEFTITDNTEFTLTLSATPAAGAYKINEFTDSTGQFKIVLRKGTDLPVEGDIWWFVITGYDDDVIVPDYVVPKVDLENDLTVIVYGGI